jgi:hypothetical protein
MGRTTWDDHDRIEIWKANGGWWAEAGTRTTAGAASPEEALRALAEARRGEAVHRAIEREAGLFTQRNGTGRAHAYRAVLSRLDFCALSAFHGASDSITEHFELNFTSGRVAVTCHADKAMVFGFEVAP